MAVNSIVAPVGQISQKSIQWVPVVTICTGMGSNMYTMQTDYHTAKAAWVRAPENVHDADRLPHR